MFMCLGVCCREGRTLRMIFRNFSGRCPGAMRSSVHIFSAYLSPLGSQFKCKGTSIVFPGLFSLCDSHLNLFSGPRSDSCSRACCERCALSNSPPQRHKIGVLFNKSPLSQSSCILPTDAPQNKAMRKHDSRSYSKCPSRNALSPQVLGGIEAVAGTVNVEDRACHTQV